jgi:hypothetical protein
MKVKKVPVRKLTKQKLDTQLDYYSYVTKMWLGASRLLPKGLRALEQALDAESVVRVEVTGKGGKSLGPGGRRQFEFITVEDHRTRLSAANSVFRLIKEIADKRVEDPGDSERKLGTALMSFIKDAARATAAVPPGAEPAETDE